MTDDFQDFGPDGYDFFVIGGGSGGVRAARIAASHGARVGLAEYDRMGGTCVIRGCVPKKLLVYGSEVQQQLTDAAGLGWTIGEARFDWPTLRDAVGAEVTRLSGIYQGLMEKNQVTVHRGRARVVAPDAVEINGVRINARRILVAVGGRPRTLDVPGADLPGAVIVSDDVFLLPKLPRRLLIVGGGYIGVEFAHVMANFGVAVTLAHKYPNVLPGFDDELRAAVDTGLRLRGIEVLADAQVTAIAAGESGFSISLTRGPNLEVDLVLAAIGRHADTASLGLADLGVALDTKGGIIVDDHGCTSVPSIFAAGDVTNRVGLTPVAIREGHAVADYLFGEPAGQPPSHRTAVDYENVAAAVFCQPPAAAVGLSEAAAVARGLEVDIYKTNFRAMRGALTGDPSRTFMKLVVERSTDRVLGVHMVGEGAPEIMQVAAIAVTMGATKADFDRTVALHPTSAEELVLLR